jgi:iron complex outermembrane receptor protein
VHLDVSDNNQVEFTLSDDNKQLNEVIVNGVRIEDLHTMSHINMKGLELDQNRGKSLGETIKQLPGLNAISSGPTVSKPVIHGMHSNRVLVINNGVRQEGQQWGAEHAPEIDPFLANRITVVKGAASVRYGADAIGGVILLDPNPLPVTKGIHTDVFTVGATNGRMGTTSATLEGGMGGKLTGLGWRIQGTLRKAGNFKTPEYFLNNTGMEEKDFSAAAGYKKNNWELGLFYSQFNSRNGIFSGSHVGNLTDLYAAFERTAPAAPSAFTYQINRSYQNVYHDIMKANATYRFANEGRLEINGARQKDLREEYDVELPYTLDPEILARPQVSFQLITHNADVAYIHPARHGFTGSTGVTGSTQGNVFKGLRYLVPNFRNYTGGVYAIERYTRNKFTLEAGVRYDYRWLKVYQLNSNTLETYSTKHDYRNITATTGVTYRINDKASLSLNEGTAWRAPSINELYIHGVHFSDASFQNGDSNLLSERSYNSGVSFSYRGTKLRIGIDGYFSYINNYIYERPALMAMTIISGTYPTFNFVQTDASIKGVDVAVQYDFLKYFTAQSKTTIVRGFNRSANNHLIYMPADRFENGITCNLHHIGDLNEPYISFENVTVLQQTRVPESSDYVAPPAGYSIYNLNAGFGLPFWKKRVRFDFTVSNLFNTVYRDYLNHNRYYADELGINFTSRLKIAI